MMRTLLCLGTAAMALAPEGCVSARGKAGGDVPPAAAAAELVTTARRVFEFYQARREANEALTPDFMERYCLASERWAEAEELAARGDRQAAARVHAEHVARLEQFQSELRATRDGPFYLTVVVDYFLARAWLRTAHLSGHRT
jgi:hypothetical protein